MEAKRKIINLEDFLTKKETALVGRENGELLLRKFLSSGLDLVKLESEYKEIEINIPLKIISINKSFFLGLFETSIQRLGKTSFFDKYQINASPYIKGKLENYVEAALLKASQGDILDV